MNTIRAYAAHDAHVIYGTAADDSLGDNIRVTVVATGLQRATARRGAPSLQVLRTGTDNVPILDAAIGGAGAGMSSGGIQAFAPNFAPNAAPTPSPSMPVGFSAYTPSIVPNMGQLGVQTIDTPAYLRTNRTQAADKVNALSSGGMEDLEIPAFLRKQAD
jgi:cell division protein FtsZ